MLTSLYLKLGVGAAMLLLLAGLGLHIYNKGEIHERALWTAKQAIETQRAQSEIIALQTKYAKLEASKESEEAAIASQYQEGLKNVKEENARVIAGINSHAIRLRDNYAVAVPACNSASPQAIATDSGDHDTGNGVLSDEASRFLLGEAEHADEVVLELQACQAKVISDLHLCNAE